MRRVVVVGGVLFAIPLLLFFALVMGKHEGATTTSKPSIAVVESPPGVLSDIPSGANTALVQYVDALTMGLHTGSNVLINQVTDESCACRVIGESFRAIYRKANLIGGDYSLKQSTVIKEKSSEITLKVVIHMTDTKHVVRKTGASEIWKGTDVAAFFTLINREGAWKIHQTAVTL